MATPPKKPSQSLTVRANLAQAIVPALSYLASRYLGLDAEGAALVAGALFAVLFAIGQIGLRRALGFEAPKG